LTQRVAILGSTGSIGCNALEVIERLGPPFRVRRAAGRKARGTEQKNTAGEPLSHAIDPVF